MVSHEQFGSVSGAVIGGVCVLAVLITPALGQSAGKTFYSDDPLLSEAAPRTVKHVEKMDIDQLYDFLDNSFVTPRREGRVVHEKATPARDVNTVGDVPNSTWYTNRHYYRRMSLAELKRGPGNSTPPSSHGTWRVVSAKSNGVMPGFVIEDEKKNRYVLKFDPPSQPELASAADVIGSKFFYALGYNTPENYVVHFSREKLEIAPGVMVHDETTGKKSPLTDGAIDQLLKPQPKSADGTYRAMASRWVPGDAIGPFFYVGTRSDDPNDIVPHEDRRELRGLRVFAAWLNHSDAKSINTLDTLVTENGTPCLKHYLIDFGSILGSAGTDEKLPWYGHEYVIDPKGTGVQMITLGFYPPAWDRSRYPKLTGVGRLDYKSFNPVSWKSDYPNPAFLLMDNEDAFWAAKQVAVFTDAEIRALVETGQFSDPRAVDWITECLIQRRNRIAEAWLSKQLPLDRFQVTDGSLKFEEIEKGRPYSVRWAAWDHGRVTRLPNAGVQLPPARTDSEYLVATITPAASDKAADDPITVYIRRGETGFRVVGVDR